jgi:hypothetical protein
MRVRSKERTISRAPIAKAIPSGYAVIMRALYHIVVTRIAADSIFSAIIAVPLFVDVHSRYLLNGAPNLG